tara:strand:+ start:62 stop:241 length:180 start_codon:yes stop_codon:yes gene_type:complete
MLLNGFEVSAAGWSLWGVANEVTGQIKVLSYIYCKKSLGVMHIEAYTKQTPSYPIHAKC